MQTNKNKTSVPPNLLRGIVITVIATTATILAFTWFIINSQVEQLVTQRTSEYAHSIARIAADSSAEALLSEDILQLNLLVENVAKDPYIRQATIYSEDGLIVSQFPNENQAVPKQQTLLDAQQQVASEIQDSELTETSQPVNSPTQSLQFIQRQENIPFIEPIVYQEITAGWFKIEIDSFLLGRKFHRAYSDIRLYSTAIALVLFSLMLFILFKMEQSIRKVTSSCHQLLLQNAIKPPNKKQAWIDAVSTLASQPLQPVKQQLQAPARSKNWQQHSKLTSGLVCVFEFEVDFKENSHIAQQLSLAQQYLNQSIQAYGVQSQGDILSGCVVPFIASHKANQLENAQSISSALCFTELVKSLMASFSGQIKLKTCLARASLLLLEDEHQLVTGITLLEGHFDIIKQQLSKVDFEQSISLFIEPQQLEKYVEVEALTEAAESSVKRNYCLLKTLNTELVQQINRKFKYIRET